MSLGRWTRAPARCGGQEDRKLSEEMMDYWTNFAKTGDPNGSGLPQWPQYNKTSEVLILDRETQATPDATRARYEFLLRGLPKAEH